jgi:hypothetical protein
MEGPTRCGFSIMLMLAVLPARFVILVLCAGIGLIGLVATAAALLILAARATLAALFGLEPRQVAAWLAGLGWGMVGVVLLVGPGSPYSSPR